jgi:hypothetical protein
VREIRLDFRQIMPSPSNRDSSGTTDAVVMDGSTERRTRLSATARAPDKGAGYEKSQSPEIRIDWPLNQSGSNAHLGKSVLDLAEFGVGVGTDRGDRSNANDDNESHHDGVFNSRRTIFGNQKLLDAVCKIFHRCPLL